MELKQIINYNTPSTWRRPVSSVLVLLQGILRLTPSPSAILHAVEAFPISR